MSMSEPNHDKVEIGRQLESLYGDIIASDPDMRARIKALLNSMIDQVEYQMRHGTPGTRATLMKAALPAMMRSLKDKTETDEVVNLRNAYLELLHEVRTTRTRVAEPEEDAEFDIPEAVSDYMKKISGVSHVQQGNPHGPTINNGG